MKKILIIKKPSTDIEYCIKSTNSGFMLASRIPGTEMFDFFKDIKIPKEWTNPIIISYTNKNCAYFTFLGGVSYNIQKPDDISDHLMIYNDVEHIWFERGWTDATDLEDSYQQISVDPDTYELGDLSSVTFQFDIPQYEPSDIKTKSDLIDIFESKGWELQK